MSDIFSDLKSMGFSNLSSLDIYEDEKKSVSKETIKASAPVISEEDYLFDKKTQCPVCDREFKSKTVKTGKPRLVGSDPDLRPRYSGVDSIKYDAIVCPYCGYAALSRYFGYMTSAQARLIKENVSSKYTPDKEEKSVFTYDEAINRYKLALLNDIVKRAKSSEKAYTCLKIGWLYRGKAETLPKDTADYDAVIKECDSKEKEMLRNAFEGFMVSRAKEDFPICGMDEATFDYLLSYLAMVSENYELSAKLASSVIVSRGANSRLKDKAREVREQLKGKFK